MFGNEGPKHRRKWQTEKQGDSQAAPQSRPAYLPICLPARSFTALPQDLSVDGLIKRSPKQVPGLRNI